MHNPLQGSNLLTQRREERTGRKEAVAFLFILCALCVLCVLALNRKTYGQSYGCAPCNTACQPPIAGVDCAVGNGCGEPHWKAWGPIPWQAFAQGEYTGPARLPHVPEYRLRVDDEIEFVYRLKRDEISRPYLLDVGDEILLESVIDPTLNRKVTIQPDGTVDLLLLGSVRVIRKTVDEIHDDLNKQYQKFYRITDINVTRVTTQAKANDLLQSVNNR